jgi:signal transduction histidine kinase
LVGIGTGPAGRKVEHVGKLLKPEYGWLLPAALDAPGPARRSTRDWVIDALCFVLGYGACLLFTGDLLSDNPTVVPEWAPAPAWLIWLDFGVGTVLAIGLWWRRTRWLTPLAVFAGLASIFTVAGAVIALIVLFTVAVHRKFAVLAVFASAAIAANAVFPLLRPESHGGYAQTMGWGLVALVITCLWGMVVRSRRQLVASLRDRAERAEAEQQLRVAQARAVERNRIAREMHDVLAHRISLLSLHAGALEIKADATPGEVTRAAGVIRASAHQALQDLREVIGVLRTDRPADAPEPPQPTLGALPALADESRSAGVRVNLQVDIEPDEVPAGTGRAAYRIVQEGLTNARKHAPGVAVRVNVAGSADDGLRIDIRNPWPVGGRAASIPGTGTGLIGLTERATLAGGRLRHGRTPQDEFALTAWLPWPT